MRLYKGSKGRDYTLSEKALAKGGEGEIVEIIDEPGCVAKLYHPEKRTEGRLRKLKAMLLSPPALETKEQVTWPLDILYDNGSFIGYTMLKLSGMVELNVMYTDQYRTTWKNYIKIARNLCVAVYAVHSAGHVCGDLNPLNIVVNPMNGRVTLVDTDSYHITNRISGKIYRCEVGQPDYIPKELQEKMKQGFTLSNAPLPTYSRETDYFALAVHIFSILMNGCHPFACAVLPSEKSIVHPQPKDNIMKGVFPFINQETGTGIPVYAPPITILPVILQQLFHRAFILGCTEPGERPGAVEWHQALEELEQQLITCTTTSAHRYYQELSACPWCELRSKMAGFKTNSIAAPTLKQTAYSTPSQKPTTLTLNQPIYISKIKLFESDIKHVPELKKRVYSYTFQKETTRGIFFEISFTNNTKASLKTNLSYRLYNRFGLIVFKTSNAFLMDPTFDTYWWGWEFIDSGYLEEGKYKIEVWFDHSNTVSSEFDVINARQAAGLPLWNASISPNTINEGHTLGRVSAASLPRGKLQVTDHRKTGLGNYNNSAFSQMPAASSASPTAGSAALQAGSAAALQAGSAAPYTAAAMTRQNVPVATPITAAYRRSYTRRKKKSLIGIVLWCMIQTALAEALLIVTYKMTASDLIPLRQLYADIYSGYKDFPGALLPLIIFYVPILMITLLIKITLYTLRSIRNVLTKIILLLIFLFVLLQCLRYYEADLTKLSMSISNSRGIEVFDKNALVDNTLTSSTWSTIDNSLQYEPGNMDSIPELAFDQNPDTAWIIRGKQGGINEWIKLNKASEAVFRQLILINGNNLSEEAYYNNNRIKKISVAFSDGSEQIAELADGFLEPQIISFKNDVKSNYIKITILETYPGRLFQSTYLPEIVVLEERDNATKLD